MAQEETIENNKLIAEFMGGEFANHNCQPTAYWEFWKDEPPSNAPYIFNRHLKYHTSWGWLMPVVEKIESLPDGKWYIHIQGNTVSIEDGNETPLWDYHINHEDPIMALFPQKPDNKPIESVYQAIVEFIKWYNENKNI